MSAAIRFERVDVVFGRAPRAALRLLDGGLEPAEIKARTGQVVAVHGASLEVPAGRITVVMGLSGSGKSTLLRVANALVPVTRGRVAVDDGSGGMVEVTRIGTRALRRLRQERIAMVFQGFALMPWRTVRANVALGLELRGVETSARRRIVDDTLALVGLQDWADRTIDELSGGMQQRVGLARALATDAPILLMDEPFSALDPLIREHVQNELLDLQRRLQKTILFVSHDLDEALKLGDRIAIMEAGRVVQAGPPETILRRPATPFVAELARHCNPLDLLTAAAVMATAAPGELAGRPTVAAAARLRHVVEVARMAGLPLRVTGATGETLGRIGAEQLTRAVLGAWSGGLAADPGADQAAVVEVARHA